MRLSDTQTPKDQRLISPVEHSDIVTETRELDADTGAANTQQEPFAPEQHSAQLKYADRSWDELNPDEQEELFDEGYGSFLDLVRANSFEGRLSHLDEIMERCFSAQITNAIFLERDRLYREDTHLAEELELSDIIKLSGKTGDYFYSQDHMANNWAKGCFLSLENDPLRTLAEIVRYESRIYPRPMIKQGLMNAPYLLNEETIDKSFERAQQTEGFKDLCRCFASNGDEYFYSSQHLSQAQAKALAEYYSVEKPRCP